MSLALRALEYSSLTLLLARLIGQYCLLSVVVCNAAGGSAAGRLAGRPSPVRAGRVGGRAADTPVRATPCFSHTYTMRRNAFEIVQRRRQTAAENLYSVCATRSLHPRRQLTSVAYTVKCSG